MSRLVLCHGVFDILHVGHFEHFRAARAYGDQLIVSVTAARWVRVAKGAGHPAHSDEERTAMLRDLRIVDEVWLCDDPTGVPAILLFRPTYYVKGADYLAPGVKDPEFQACVAVGARIVYTPTRKRSVMDMVKAFA